MARNPTAAAPKANEGSAAAESTPAKVVEAVESPEVAALKARVAELEAEVERERASGAKDLSEMRARFDGSWAEREREIAARIEAEVEKRVAARLSVIGDAAAELVLPASESASLEQPARYRACGKLALSIDGKRVIVAHEGEIPSGYDVKTLPRGSYEAIR